MPAEWEPHAATWIGWPVRASDWPGRLAMVPPVFVEFVRALSPSERVRLLVPSRTVQARAAAMLKRSGVPTRQVDWVVIPTERNWTRDSGPMFVRRQRRDGALAIVDFRFTAWARLPSWRKDDAMPAAVARRRRLPRIVPMHAGRRVVLEGGAIDVNGAGTLLATEECLLDQEVQVRNPGFGRADYEAVFRRYLGAAQTLWLGRGIAGDDTHGHVDDLCRFVNPTTVVLCHESRRADVNYRALAENRERLERVTLASGARLQVIPLPMPGPVVVKRRRLPASYANFYIGNTVVLVPTFKDPRDREALGILAECFPGRKVVGIHAHALVWGGGAIHCLTQQEPVARPAR